MDIKQKVHRIINGETRLYARWEDVDAKITFNPNGGFWYNYNGREETTNRVVTVTDRIDLSRYLDIMSDNLYRYGRTFIRWSYYQNSYGYGSSSRDDDLYNRYWYITREEIWERYNGNLVLYAGWR